MPIATIEVAVVTAPDQWSLSGAPNKVAAVNSPDDDAATYIFCSDLAWLQQYSLGASGIPALSTINSVSVSSRHYSSGAGAYRQGLVLGVNSSETADLPTANVWTTVSSILGRPGGGVWALADLATLEVYVNCQTGATNVRVTTLQVIVDYNLPAAGNGSGAVFGPRPLYPRGRKRIIH